MMIDRRGRLEIHRRIGRRDVIESVVDLVRANRADSWDECVDASRKPIAAWEEEQISNAASDDELG